MRRFVLSILSLIVMSSSMQLWAANGSTTVLRSEQIRSILSAYQQNNLGQAASVHVSERVETYLEQLIIQKSNTAANAFSEPTLLTVSVGDFVGLINRSHRPRTSYESERNLEYRQLLEAGRVRLDPATHLLVLEISDEVSIEIQPNLPLSVPAESEAAGFLSGE